MSNWKDAVDRGDFRKEVEHRNAINSIFNALYSQYGQVNVVQYVQILKDEENVETGTFGTHDGSACTRNLNGSLYTGACSFWEKVQFFFSLACSGMPKDTPTQINSYFNCVQADICDICG